MPVEREEATKEKRARYRKIEVRMWGDEKFRNLSPMPPCGQGLWVYLLTGPHTSAIPGLFRVGRAAMAEELDWDIEAFDEAFREAFQQGMVKADWKAKVVWVPNSLPCNKPESPNVVTSWRDSWELLPECDLKREAYEFMRGFICGLGEAFERAFHKAIVKPSLKDIPKTIGNQEQEQEQEQLTGTDKVKTLVELALDVSDQNAEESGPAVPEQQHPGLPGVEPAAHPAATGARGYGADVSTLPKHDVEAELIAYLNEKAGRSFEAVESNRKLVRGRLAEGATPEKIRAVIDAKVEQWQDDPKMAQYLQPATLFNSTKFAQYVGALGARMPAPTPMRLQRSEKFDPLAYVNQIHAHTENDHERHADCTDVQFVEVDR
jgi:uncharacterized phage protein (TIGR02220 family)